MPREVQMDFDSVASADELREAIGALGQEVVAERAGITHAMVSYWLAGKRTMSLENRLRVMIACGGNVLVKAKLQTRPYAKRKS